MCAFNGDLVRDLAAQFLALAEKQGDDGAADGWTSANGHFLAAIRETLPKDERILIVRSPYTIHVNIARLTARFGHDIRVAILSLSVVGTVATWLS